MGGLRQTALYAQDAAVTCNELCTGVLQHGSIAIHQRDAATFRGESLRNASTDAGCRAGHNGNLSVKPVHDISPWFVRVGGFATDAATFCPFAGRHPTVGQARAAQSLGDRATALSGAVKSIHGPGAHAVLASAADD